MVNLRKEEFPKIADIEEEIFPLNEKTNNDRGRLRGVCDKFMGFCKTREREKQTEDECNAANPNKQKINITTQYINTFPETMRSMDGRLARERVSQRIVITVDDPLNEINDEMVGNAMKYLIDMVQLMRKK